LAEPSGEAERNIKFQKTMKKQYTKPSMEVYDLKQHPSLLCGSDPTRGWDDQFGYIPTTTDLSSRA